MSQRFETDNNENSRPSTAKIADSGPLGLTSFAITTLTYSLMIAGVQGIKIDYVGLGLALFHGGFIQLLAGMWEMYHGNTFSATVFSSYGGFWMSFGLIYLPFTGIVKSYEGREDEFEHAIGIYLISWTIFTFIMFICSLRTKIGLTAALFVLTITYIFLVLKKFTGNHLFDQIGGSLGVVTAVIGFYLAFSDLFTTETPFWWSTKKSKELNNGLQELKLSV
ncbi:hypothetical protein G9A89_013910 [Geosiphon pyriformis]|nr:hypothetical protein G9A89_013910 [Geosiphon pyriformis]